MATVYSAQNGNWSDPTTWSTGALPATGDYVVIRHTVTVDGDFSATQLGRITFDSSYAGKIIFATDRNTALKCDYFLWYFTRDSQKIQCGTPTSPLPAQYTCRIIQSAASTNYFYLRGRVNCTLQLCGDPAYYGGVRMARINADWTTGQSFTVDGDLTGKWRTGLKLGITSIDPTMPPANSNSYRYVSCYATIASLSYDAQTDSTTITISEANPGFTVYAGSPAIVVSRNIQIIHEQGNYDVTTTPYSSPTVDHSGWGSGAVFQLSNVWFHGFGANAVSDDMPLNNPNHLLEDLSFSCQYYGLKASGATISQPRIDSRRNIALVRPTFFHCMRGIYGRSTYTIDGLYTEDAIAAAVYALRSSTSDGVDNRPIVMGCTYLYHYTLRQTAHAPTLAGLYRYLDQDSRLYLHAAKYEQGPWGDPAPSTQPGSLNVSHSRIEGAPAAISSYGPNNAYPDYLGDPGNFLSTHYAIAVTKSTTVTKDSDWSVMVTTLSSLTNHPYIYPRPITHPNGDWGFEADADTPITVVVYVRAEAVLGAFPTADQLYLEVEYLSDPASAQRTVARSTQTITANDTWTALTVNITPARAGWVKCTLYLHDYHDDNWALYVEPAIQLG